MQFASEDGAHSKGRLTIGLRAGRVIYCRILKKAKSYEVFVRLAETFQALGDASRIQIVWALSQSELCVGDLAKLISMSQPAVSHHLRTLRNLHLVRVRRQGRVSFYSLDDEHIDRILREGMDHVEDLRRK